ncbi:hypothetical protein N136_04084 [Leifsonia aquatica ATCC 14665]|uniref:Uncharacterized protein n=1 Tax=Leifsonia aquatica ATCC 14665 TaxID=1358026 RepID=U2T4E9_LEIAQ|nr:hypothetical protein N136_04084 [Leifsonia aquatica ATCC 14665]
MERMDLVDRPSCSSGRVRPSSRLSSGGAEAEERGRYIYAIPTTELGGSRFG